MTVAAILLAAGESTRMGDVKALLDWGGRPLIAHQVAELLAGGAGPVFVVLGHEAARLRAHLPDDPRVRVAFNPDYRQGRSTSIRTGLAALPAESPGFFIVNVDQPTGREVIEQLIAAHLDAGALLSVPVVADKRGHPPLFSAALRDEVATVSEESDGLKRIVRARETDILRVPIDSPLVATNLNRREDYLAARSLATPGDPPGRSGDLPPGD